MSAARAAAAGHCRVPLPCPSAASTPASPCRAPTNWCGACPLAGTTHASTAATRPAPAPSCRRRLGWRAAPGSCLSRRATRALQRSSGAGGRGALRRVVREERPAPEQAQVSATQGSTADTLIRVDVKGFFCMPEWRNGVVAMPSCGPTRGLDVPGCLHTWPNCLACRNRFHPYLCIDPQPDQQPGARDQEEFIQVEDLVGTSLPPRQQPWVRHGCSPAAEPCQPWPPGCAAVPCFRPSGMCSALLSQ